MYFIDKKTGYPAFAVVPPQCEEITISLIGDGMGAASAGGMAIKAGLEKWKNGNNKGFVIIGHTESNYESRYEKFKESGTAEGILSSIEEQVGKKMAKINLIGYSRGVYGLAYILESQKFGKKLGEAMVIDAKTSKAANLIKQVAANKKIQLGVASGSDKDSVNTRKYFENDPNIDLQTEKYSHWGMFANFALQQAMI